MHQHASISTSCCLCDHCASQLHARVNAQAHSAHLFAWSRPSMDGSGVPGAEYECEGHAWQAESEVFPVSGENVPAGQRLHSAVPLRSLYVPVAQASHGPPSGPVNPGLHTQWVIFGAPSFEFALEGQPRHVSTLVAPVAVLNFPCGHVVHAALPLISLYVPATHSSHGPWLTQTQDDDFRGPSWQK